MNNKKIKDWEEHQEVYNTRLGIKKAMIDGYHEKPIVTITDEMGKLWVAEVGSDFHKEWKPIKNKIKTTGLFTKEELNLTISQVNYLFKTYWCNGDFEVFSNYSENPKKIFDKQVILLKSVLKKLRNEKKKLIL